MNKPVIHLIDHAGLGLVIGWPSGIRYSNQTGGTACLTPEMEGVFIPVANDLTLENELISPANLLCDYFMGPKYNGSGACAGIDDEDADAIEAIIHAERSMGYLRVDRTRLKESHEAWIHVIIVAEEDAVCGLFEGFSPYPRPGVLTWTNSD